MLTTREKQCVSIAVEAARVFHKEICENCKWFELEEFSDKIGFCTRYPPIFQSKQVMPNEHVSNVSEWPTVTTSLSCGEFKEKDTN